MLNSLTGSRRLELIQRIGTPIRQCRAGRRLCRPGTKQKQILHSKTFFIFHLQQKKGTKWEWKTKMNRVVDKRRTKWNIYIQLWQRQDITERLVERLLQRRTTGPENLSDILDAARSNVCGECLGKNTIRPITTNTPMEEDPSRWTYPHGRRFHVELRSLRGVDDQGSQVHHAFQGVREVSGFGQFRLKRIELKCCKPMSMEKFPTKWSTDRDTLIIVKSPNGRLNTCRSETYRDASSAKNMLVKITNHKKVSSNNGLNL